MNEENLRRQGRLSPQRCTKVQRPAVQEMRFAFLAKGFTRFKQVTKQKES